jgi:hypothetical protein
MKINEILNYNKDQQLLQHIGDAFLPNGQLKFPVDVGGLVPDDGSMHDQTSDEVPDDMMDMEIVNQRPTPIRRFPRVGGHVPLREPGTPVLGDLVSSPRWPEGE